MSSLYRQPVKPRALRPGDTVGIVAPASNIRRADLEAGCEALRRAGIQPILFDSILERDLYFAGSVQRRARELEEMFVRDDVRAILCARGGYGANYLLKELDLEIDQSASQDFCWLQRHHYIADIFSRRRGPFDFSWSDGGQGLGTRWRHRPLIVAIGCSPGTMGWDVALNEGVSAIVEGEAEGVLYGGCLSILVASLGTPYEIKTAGTILFLEDVAAKPYQMDRMLMQLKLAGHFDGVRGIVFGEMLDCVQTANQGYTLQDVVTRIVGDLGVPVAYGVRSGHVIAGNITLPFGVRAKLMVRTGQVGLRILESAVTP